jgi:hypothetical protein
VNGGVKTIEKVTVTPYPSHFTIYDYLHIIFPCCITSIFETASLNVLRIVYTSVTVVGEGWVQKQHFGIFLNNSVVMNL